MDIAGSGRVHGSLGATERQAPMIQGMSLRSRPESTRINRKCTNIFSIRIDVPIASSSIRKHHEWLAATCALRHKIL
jgi:hypothetical protein